MAWSDQNVVGFGRDTTNTTVVATSDASVYEKTSARYVLTGTNDQTLISKALSETGRVAIVGRSVYIGTAGLTIGSGVVDCMVAGTDDGSEGCIWYCSGTVTLTSGRIRNARIQNTASLSGGTLLKIRPTALTGFRGIWDQLENVSLVDTTSKSAGSRGLSLELVSTAGSNRTYERCNLDVATSGFDTGIYILLDQSGGGSTWSNANQFHFKMYGSNTNLVINCGSGSGFVGNHLRIYSETDGTDISIPGTVTSVSGNKFDVYYGETPVVISTSSFRNIWELPSSAGFTQLTPANGDDLVIRRDNTIQNAYLLPLQMPTPTALTIANGEITVGTSSYYTVDTEAGAATDDLDKISGGAPGQIIWLRTANDARDVQLRDGFNNIVNLGGNYTLSTTTKLVGLMKVGTVWTCMHKN